MIDLAKLEAVLEKTDSGLKFRDPDAAEKLEGLARTVARGWSLAPDLAPVAAGETVPRRRGGKPKHNVRRKARNHMARDINLQTRKRAAIYGAIQEIDEIRIEAGGREPSVEDKREEKPRYVGPLVDLIDLLCEQLVVTAPSGHTVYRAYEAGKPAEV